MLVRRLIPAIGDDVTSMLASIAKFMLAEGTLTGTVATIAVPVMPLQQASRAASLQSARRKLRFDDVNGVSKQVTVESSGGLDGMI